MKRTILCRFGLCIVLLSIPGFAYAQEVQKEEKSKTEAAINAAGKVASEAGKVTAKLGGAGARSTAKNVLVPTAKLLWDPVITKVAPKALGESAKLTGKGIKNGFKLIFKRKKSDNSIGAAISGT